MKILKQNNTNIWFIVALEEEFYNKDANIIYTGVGKINATMATQYLLDHFQVDKLINVGTAGGKDDLAHKVYQIIGFKQRHVWTDDATRKEVNVCEPCNVLLNDCADIAYGIQWHFGYIYTGDTFVENINDSSYDIVDMESFAIAYVCRENMVYDKFYCFKYISDSGEHADWEQSLQKCNVFFNDLYQKLKKDGVI
jgi:adenosylhomocysteine nucleosidase